MIVYDSHGLNKYTNWQAMPDLIICFYNNLCFTILIAYKVYILLFIYYS